MALEISRKDIPEGDIVDYPSEDRFIKLPIMPYMELLGITPIPSQVAIINAINNPKYRFISVSYTHLTLPTNREV